MSAHLTLIDAGQHPVTRCVNHRTPVPRRELSLTLAVDFSDDVTVRSSTETSKHACPCGGQGDIWELCTVHSVFGVSLKLCGVGNEPGSNMKRYKQSNPV